ncbi:hypothetical protein N7522_011920 [Penicillium canescens]|nr:hypothetical protein N7522_011920 [Penicillium canescens]
MCPHRVLRLLWAFKRPVGLITNDHMQQGCVVCYTTTPSESLRKDPVGWMMMGYACGCNQGEDGLARDCDFDD